MHCWVTVVMCLIILFSLFASAIDNASIMAASKVCRRLQPWRPDRMCFIRDEHNVLKEDEQLKEIQQQAVNYSLQSFRDSNSSGNDIYIYIHAHIISSGSPVGVVILDKILDKMRAYGLMQVATAIYLCLYGSNALVEDIISTYGGYSHKIIVLRGLDMFSSFYEFPTLSVMYHHAKRYHPSSKILYLHTKGITSPTDEGRSHWRDVMLLWNVQFWSYSVQQLSRGWVTTGIKFKDFPWPHYSGNFFWTRADFLTQAIPPEELIWYWRFGAERWLFADRNNLTRVCKAEETNEHNFLPHLGDSLSKSFKLTNCPGIRSAKITLIDNE